MNASIGQAQGLSLTIGVPETEENFASGLRNRGMKTTRSISIKTDSQSEIVADTDHVQLQEVKSTSDILLPASAIQMIRSGHPREFVWSSRKRSRVERQY